MKQVVSSLKLENHYEAVCAQVVDTNGYELLRVVIPRCGFSTDLHYSHSFKISCYGINQKSRVNPMLRRKHTPS